MYQTLNTILLGFRFPSESLAMYGASNNLISCGRSLLSPISDSIYPYMVKNKNYRLVKKLILDSFAGSGTTAHAVLNLNKQDGGHRRFILVEMCDYAETITAERVRRVIDGYGEGSKTVEGTGGSFAFYELGDTIYDPQTGLLNDNADTEQIRRYIWYSETNTPYHSPKDCTDDASRVVKDTAAAGDADALVRGRFGTNRMTMLRTWETTRAGSL